MIDQLNVPFSIVDVFTQDRFRGNPVAVVHDGSALSSVQMQSIATEFGFSETTFILPASDLKFHAQVRIFTPHAEIPFAGHPNIGTTFVIGTQKTSSRLLGDRAVLDELGGDVTVFPIRQDGNVVGAEIEAPQTLSVLDVVPIDALVHCLGLKANDICTDRIKPCVASVGLPFAFVEVADLDVLADIECDIPAFRIAAARGPQTVDGFAVCVFVVVDSTKGHLTVRSRVFSPLGYPPEDPATGSASGALAALLAKAVGSADISVLIVQGVEMGRRSEIEVDVTSHGERVLIRGRCVSVASGVLTI